MKKFIVLLVLGLSLISCSDDDTNFAYVLIPVDSAIVPESFEYHTHNAITITYTLPNTCYGNSSIYYQYAGEARIVAVEAIEFIDSNCSEQTRQLNLTFDVHAIQREDYIFKFWKGEDANGDDIFEEYVVPVI